MAFLHNGIFTIGFPCNDVYNILVHTYIHTYIRSVSSLDPFTAPIKNAPTYSYTSVFCFFFLSKQNTNISQALSENKAIRKPVLALEQCTRKKKKKKKKKENHQVQNYPARRKTSSFLLACSFFIFFLKFLFHCPVFSSKMLCCQAIKRTCVPLSLAYCSEIYTKNVHT